MKKKLNRKPAYKKGGESWVSDKMANLPMYQMGTQTTLSSTLGFKQSPMNLQAQENKLDPNSLNYGENWANNNPLPQMGMNGFSYSPNAVGNLNEVPSDILKQNQEQSSSNNTISEDTTQPQQFMNNYGGVDIESRLAYGANQLGKGNTAQGILGIASGALGIARTGVGAYAAGNREKYIMNEYNDKVNKSMTPRTMSLEDGGMIDFMQKGGYNYNKTGNIDLNNNDVKQVNKNLQGLGLQFDEEFAKAYFSTELTPPTQTVNSQPKIQNTNVLDITSDGQFTDRKVWRNQKPEWYVGKQEAIEGRDYTTVPYKQWENYKMTPEYNKFQNRDTRVAEFQEGGQAVQDQVMQIIQMYAQMAQQDPQAIMEQLQQMSPEEQQQAIQQMAQSLQQPQQEQQFQKGGEFAKKLTGEYTTPLDENDPTINAEVEKDEYLQSPDGEITRALGETHEKNGTKVNLEGGTRIVSDHLKLGGVNAKHYKENFDLEVKATDTYAKVLDRFTKKSGLQKIVDEQEKVIEQLKKSEESVQGSSISESTNNLNKMFLSEKLSELEQEKSPLLEARKALMDDVFQRQEASKPAEESSQEQFQIGGTSKPYGENWTNEDKKQRYLGFLQQARFSGYEGNLTGKESNIDKSWGELQAYMRSNKPEETEAYAKSARMTAKGVTMLKQSRPDLFKSLNIPLNKKDSEYSQEETDKLKTALVETGTTPQGFWLEQFNDNLGAYRFPVLPTDLKAVGANIQQISAPQLPNFYKEPEKSPTTENTEVGKIKDQQEDTRKSLNLMTLPNQSPMMPDSLEGALKITRRYDRVDPMQFSPEQQLGAIKGQEAQAMEQINQLPESQRAGALANLSAITQENLAKVYSDVNRTNLVADNQAQQFNAQTQAQEENARGVDLQSYENKIMRAKATTDADRRGYYNQLQAIDLANYNAVNNTNLLNQMYENYGYNGSSVEQTQGAPKFNYAPNGIPLTNTKKKTTKKRFGGKI
jgi:hypothetical protein